MFTVYICQTSLVYKIKAVKLHFNSTEEVSNLMK